MIRNLIVAAVVFVTGYIVGVRAGFKTAVDDYVNNDAQLLEKMSNLAEDEQIPEAVQEKIEEADSSTAKRGFR